MSQRFRRGVFTVSTLDRLDDLRRMVTSLWRHNKVQVQVMLARDWNGAHELKTRMGALTTFDTTVFLDTDIYVKGDITELFRIAEKGKLAIYRHLSTGGGPGHWNSGVMAFNHELGLRLSKVWAPRRLMIANTSPSSREIKSYYRTDQKSLQDVIEDFPIYKLSAIYNYIIPERTLEDEEEDWEVVRIFHFLHKRCFHRVKSRAYREWMEL